MTSEQLLEQFTQWMQAVNRAAKTIWVHRYRVRHFLDFAESRGVYDLAAVTGSLIREYQKHLSHTPNKRGQISTVGVRNQHIGSLKCFFHFLKVEDMLPHDPARDVIYARTPKRLPRVVLTTRELKKLLRQPDTKTILGYRDRTILEVLYSTALRRRELLNLDLEDLDLEGRTLTVRMGKGYKDRVVPVGTIAARFLETYLNGIRPVLLRNAPDGQPLPAVFISTRGRRLSRNALGELVVKYAQAAGITGRVTPHTLRHTCATHMIRNGANVRHIQELLGHANLNSTQKYLWLTVTDLKAAHQKYHPREKDR